MRGFLVTGTDTDVGKTWFMLKFGALLEKENQDFHFLKNQLNQDALNQMAI